MTRREWFMQFGAGAVLSGWSASDLDAAELPPGVYEPSRDHLGHALAGHGLAAGREADAPLIASVDGDEQSAAFTEMYRLAADNAAVARGLMQWRARERSIHRAD